jgi:uncharacterized RDD family membrane protein YckC
MTEGGETVPALPSAGLGRRLASMVYEALIVVAVAFLAGLAFVFVYAAIAGDVHVRVEGTARLALQLYLLVVVGAYFVWFWRRGHTLPMKTWRLRLVASGGAPVGTRAALLRYACAAIALIPAFVGTLELRQNTHSLFAWLALAPGCVAIAWCLWDADGQALYDRLAGTRLVRSG